MAQLDEEAPGPADAGGTPPPFPFPIRSALDPSPEYARLRAEKPVSRVTLPSGDTAWIVTRYEDVRFVFNDARFSRQAATRPEAPKLMPGVEGDPDSIVSKDAPDHTRLRRLVAPAFTVRRIEGMREGIQSTVDGLLDTMEEAGKPGDVVSSLAGPLPIITICDLLGVPPADRDRFREWSDTMFRTSPDELETAVGARNALIGYLAAMVQERRAKPADDLLGVLIAARDNDDRLSERELISFAGGLIVAGYETTANRLANAVLVLLRNPDQLELLRADPELIADAVEELLRFIPGGAAGGLMRVAVEDVAVGGELIRAGDGVIAITNSANRDESVWDSPDRFDIIRKPGSHTSFGHGIHHCVGAQLARLELQIGIGTLLRRFPGLRLAVPEAELPWKKNVVIHALEALPVTW
ncbi:cytochrome P450 [Streptomyces hygroscopicus subsp. sporocinereus]|uniref:Cytochrome P450 n=1 Tax=Streptomyces hygroscopicus TaxID=1912 RepID=A0ABQ3U987_STRHY|nr:cytochrome P450 [Streptomyces hygroscopicus]GHJ32165.1 cytochrome P450 [Streptomyces hygroscopicus]